MTMPPDRKSSVLIQIENATFRLGNRFVLPGISWVLQEGEQWAVLGPNGSGKSTFARALLGEIPVVEGELVRDPRRTSRKHVGYVSFEEQQFLMDREVGYEDARYFSGDLSGVTTVQQLLDTAAEAITTEIAPDLMRHYKLQELRHRDIRSLSTGEFRKVLIARALLPNPSILILDEPYDGLDEAARKLLKNVLDAHMDSGKQLILVTHRIQEIPEAASHILCLKNGRLFRAGTRLHILRGDLLAALYGNGADLPSLNEGNSLRESLAQPVRTQRKAQPPSTESEILVEMTDVTVRYGDRCILNRLSWKVKKGENWCIFGPNGSGKTTLLRLIFADHPQAYTNSIFLFGKERGSGESIWDIRRNIGFISGEFQLSYRKSITALHVIISGFYDSVGLYRHHGAKQERTALDWMDRLQISDLKKRRFDRLSYGERRLVLIARAIVKTPQLLILDEPCQGLDLPMRRRVVEAVDEIGKDGKTTILYVTHHADTVPACIHRVLTL